MQYTGDPDWRDRFVLTSHALTGGERNALARSASVGHMVRIAVGVYLSVSDDASRTDAERHRDLVYARQLTSRRPLVFSHASAAALWRLPRLGSWPNRVHALAGASQSRTTAGLTRHVSALVDPDIVDGVCVTPLARTVVDLARLDPFEQSVVAADAALAGVRIGGQRVRVERQAVITELEALGIGRGTRRARLALEFASADSGSPGESLSRVSVARAGLRAPELQHLFMDPIGRMYADFWWAEAGVIGEFDGMGKYLRHDLTGGKSVAEVVLAEKVREDRLRRQSGVSTVVRWGWDTAASPSRLGRLLRDAGVR